MFFTVILTAIILTNNTPFLGCALAAEAMFYPMELVFRPQIYGPVSFSSVASIICALSWDLLAIEP